MSPRAVAVLVASAAVQLALATLPDTMGDLLEYRSWTRQITSSGLAGAYWPQPASPGSESFVPPIDYPPLLPYLFWAIGAAVKAVSPAALDGNDRLLDFLIRLPLIASSLLLAVLVHREVRRTAPAGATFALAAIALNPAIVFDTAWWGQADAACALLITGSLVALVRGRPEWAWAMLAAGALVKPFAYPLAPLLALETLRRFGWRRALRSAAAGAATVGAVFLPFLWSGHVAEALRALVTQVDAMPYVSVNAHNLWWLLGRGLPWTFAYARGLGPLSWNTLSLLSWGALYLVVLALLLRSREPRSLYVAGATVALGFFVLSTHMHENHAFFALPLVALVAAESRPARVLLLVLSAAMLANMALHDPFLTDWARAHTPGPQVTVPARLEPQLELRERFTRLGYPWIVRQMEGRHALAGLLATLLNAQLVALSFAAWLVLLWRARGLDGMLRLACAPAPRGAWVAAAAFAVATGAPFVAHVLRFEREHYFLLRFQEARIATDDPARVGVYTFDLDGDRRPTLWLHPPSRVTYQLVPPPRAALRTAIALRPAVWSSDKGDGVVFEVLVEEAGVRRTLFSRYLDPKHDPEDRRWEPVTIDLSRYAGRAITLTFATSGGPAGNIDYDWAGFGNPTLEAR